MITSYKQLTGKYLKKNKKRTILTIIGIMLSVALISTIGLFFKGMQDAEIQDAKNNYGSYHLVFKNTNANIVSKIVNNPKVSRSGSFTRKERVKINDKLVADIITATDKALELFPYKTKLGRLPEKQNEIAVEQWELKYISKDAKLGNKIKLNNKEYNLVGVLQDNIDSQMKGTGIILLKNNNIVMQKSMLLVEISSKTKLKTALNELKQLGEKNSVIGNEALIQLQGAGDASSGMGGLLVALSIIIGIVVISTIAVIYNSFQISVVERIKQFGLLRAIGTTPRQIRKIVLREATILAVIAIPLGLICSLIAINGIILAFKLIGADSVIPIKISISPMVLSISAAVGLFAIYLSALVPAYFAGRISPLNAISGRTSITKEKIKRRKNRVVQKIFGFEGALAAKNIKRNKKRYRITVFSIVISVVLFVTFKSFMDMSLNISSDLNESKNIHFSVVANGKDTGKTIIDNKTEKDVKQMESVNKVYRVYDSYYFDGLINKNSKVKEINDIGNVYQKATLDGVEKTLIRSSIVIYDKESLEVSKKYLQSGRIDIEKLNKENGVILINKNVVYNQNTKKNYYGPIADVKVGDEIELQYDTNGGSKSNKTNTKFDKKKLEKVKIMAILNSDPFNYRGSSDGLKIITTEKTGEKLIGINDVKPTALNIVLKDIKSEETSKTGIENITKSNSYLMVINNIDNNRKSKSTILMVKILLYGFVLVVSLIGSVNIINTLTTNIILRKREFATLKSIGLTQKGLKKMIVLEGLLYGMVGAIYGSIIGAGISFLLFKSMGNFREFGWMVPWQAIGIAIVASLIIGYISVLSPLSRIKQSNLIESVREDF
ncbi:FtsX-like permease family protein [Clostridium estertheticum]|uniref:ABC transporter permease n=1 Tax=Clostridium estertheticum TaxID=238834 RepID=UPI001CF0F786|nr:FtsX-like permease family protein [Clostridium estertheticum]MCB2307935.1 FtsX-like permease family protein [Clostridium estertheticum]MCB2346059.1 FtsX-like permease family protein [Clostridium estertheticum]MCB2351317.1 FtsX-like permease family protein [Clostridium estertheticum]WAG44204.1 FtsX-like permease family protein [Clostridium estertheticum]